MERLEIKKIGLIEMTESEKNAIFGGKLPWWAWAIWAVALVVAIILEG
ncbi:hypothetical protein [Daejeonella sp.]|nr:hypothetical protein [Daejeonella sp.]